MKPPFQPQIGMIVRLWSDAATYGVITKINRVTFDVEHNLQGKTRYDLRSYSCGDYSCKQNIFRCTPVYPSEITPSFMQFLLGKGGVYRGKWWDGVEHNIMQVYKDHITE